MTIMDFKRSKVYGTGQPRDPEGPWTNKCAFGRSFKTALWAYIELDGYRNFVCLNICLFTLTFYKVDFLGLANWSNLWESVVLDTFWTLDSV